jgi:hypothetical protein
VLRRSFLSTIAAISAGCASKPAPPASPRITSAAAPPPAPPPIERTLEVLDWQFPAEFGGPKRCVLLVPKPIAPGTKLPVLVALHGLGETIDPVTGANGWLKSYELDKSYVRLFTPPLEPAAFQGFVTSERLSEINEDLAARPFGGLIVACPYMPKEIGGPLPIEVYARWLGERLLPRIRQELPAETSAKSTGIDGVSLGGWAAIRIAMARPDLFGAVGALQPAVMDAAMVEWATALIAEKLGNRPFRIVTSTEDLYRYTLTDLDKKLKAKSIAHEFLLTPGPHDYPWNKGPGGIEMLLFHDRVLRA